MKTPNSMTGDWRRWARTIWVAWLYSLLLPLLVLLLWQSSYGMTIALCAFFASGAGLTARAAGADGGDDGGAARRAKRGGIQTTMTGGKSPDSSEASINCHWYKITE